MEGAEQFARCCAKIPPGRTVSLVISRDGNVQTIAVQLADRKKMEHDVWNRLDNGGSEPASSGRRDWAFWRVAAICRRARAAFTCRLSGRAR